jgi:SAM-dependent methyltransferase
MEIIDKVMEKKPYKFINKDFVKSLSQIIKAKTEREKLKLMRAKLRKISTSALPLKFYKKFEKIQFSQDVLNTHRSTRERENIYPWFINEIKNTKAKKIVDFGCGFNLLALYYNNFIPQNYIGYDIDGAVVQFINRFVKEKQIDAKIYNKNIIDMEFEKADLYLCLKVFDALEDIEQNVTKKILDKLKTKTKFIIVSFSNITLGGRKHLKERKWFEDMLFSLKLKFEKHAKGNETFYFIEC